MKGDFSRLTFDPDKQFTRVLMQQGRVQLDADWNEQSAIFWHYLRQLTKGVIGPHGTSGEDDFKVTPIRTINGITFKVSQNGFYYTDGILCQGDEGEAAFSDLDTGKSHLIYLDAWERHLTHVQEKGVREVALGGPDTATRAQVVWRVKVKEEVDSADLKDERTNFQDKIYALEAALRNLNTEKANLPIEQDKLNLQSEGFKTFAALFGGITSIISEFNNNIEDMVESPTPKVAKVVTKLNSEVIPALNKELDNVVDPEEDPPSSANPTSDKRIIGIITELNTLIRIETIKKQIEEKRADVETATTAFETAKGEYEKEKEDLENAELKELKTNARLSATTETKSNQSDGDTDPCPVSPDSNYRGLENQLYRVEIHRTGTAWNGEGEPPNTAATFKWSRENGSVIFPVVSAVVVGDNKAVVKLQHLGRDDSLSLKAGDWVEVVDDGLALNGKPGPLLEVLEVNRMDLSVKLDLSTLPQGETLSEYDEKSANHPLLRRWDHKPDEKAKGARFVKESEWIELEGGVNIKFHAQDTGDPPTNYRSGDYWLIPARTATGDIEWPFELENDKEVPKKATPHSIEHHYAPLAVLLSERGSLTAIDCRRVFEALGKTIIPVGVG